ncbi:hypothetical protein DRQ36_03430 [bacterium]|nr:MAG: hypothetical protein DRQ36_03430 [bacterium]
MPIPTGRSKNRDSAVFTGLTGSFYDRFRYEHYLIRNSKLMEWDENIDIWDSTKKQKFLFENTLQSPR